jgi:hypothetical protein
MSCSPPQSPVQEIQIDTPPPSPTNLHPDYLQDTPHPGHSRRTPPLVSNITPVRRKKQLYGPLRHKRLRVDCLEDSDELPTDQLQTTDDESIINDGFPPTDDLRNSSAQSQPARHEETYERYLDLVLADCVGFYQISKTVFVVQGWDPRVNTGTVSVQLFKIFGCLVEVEGLISQDGIIFNGSK